MKNSKIIVLNGFQRGGTNIVWNLIQSHPGVCAPFHETGQIIYSEVFRRTPRLAKKMLTNPLITKTPIGFPLRSAIDTALSNRKMANFGHVETGTKYDGVPYTRREVEASTICLKSVNLDLELTDLWASLYKKSYFIGLMRNGYALCESWTRRGVSALLTGEVYRLVGERMIHDQNRHENYKIIKFEDVLKDPFGVASQLFEFADLQHLHLNKLRLMSKKLLLDDGKYGLRFGHERQRYWLDKTEIWRLLDPTINQRQAHLLVDHDRRLFEKRAKRILDYFGYTAERADEFGH